MGCTMLYTKKGYLLGQCFSTICIMLLKKWSQNTALVRSIWQRDKAKKQKHLSSFPFSVPQRRMLHFTAVPKHQVLYEKKKKSGNLSKIHLLSQKMRLLIMNWKWSIISGKGKRVRFQPARYPHAIVQTPQASLIFEVEFYFMPLKRK